MRRLTLSMLGLSAVMLASCGEAGGNQEQPPGSEPQPTPAPAPAAAPARREPSAFTGDWATRPDLCAEGRFRITETGLTTAGEVSCRWTPADVQRTQAGWLIAARCRAEGPEQPAQLTLTGGQESLLIEGAPFQPLPLARCPAAAG